VLQYPHGNEAIGFDFDSVVHHFPQRRSMTQYIELPNVARTAALWRRPLYIGYHVPDRQHAQAWLLAPRTGEPPNRVAHGRQKRIISAERATGKARQ
jgi:hypothetical protein